jgi:predicted kinase
MAARDKARLHFLSALGKLEKPGKKPCLVLLGGLPGSGKSSLARLLEKEEGFHVFSSDVVRKELAGLPLSSRPGEGFQTGIYTPEWNSKTFSEILKRVESALLKGERVLVDATFTRHMARDPFWKTAGNYGIPFALFICKGGRETARQRLSRTDRFGSDADLKVYEEMEKSWEEPFAFLGAHTLNAEQPLSQNIEEMMLVLRERGLAD